MAITLVASGALSGTANNGTDVTITLPTMTSGDRVVVLGGHGRRTGSSYGPSTAGYTQHHLRADPGTTGFPVAGVWSKVMGGTPDANVVCFGSANTSDAANYMVYVLRGVDATTPIDVAVTEASSVDPPSLSGLTAGAWVIAFASASVNDSTVTVPSGYSNLLRANLTETNPTTMVAATKEVAAGGAEDPASFSDLTATNPYAFTVAFRPAGPGGGTVSGSGAASGQAGTAAGSGTATTTGAGTAAGAAGTAAGAGTAQTTGAGAAAGAAGQGAGAGTVTATGASTAAGAEGEADGSGTATATGSGAASGAPGQASGSTGTPTTTGTGAPQAEPGQAAGAGTATTSGGGAASAPAGEAGGAGTATVTGSGGATAPEGAAAGADAVTPVPVNIDVTLTLAPRRTRVTVEPRRTTATVGARRASATLEEQ